MDPLRMLEPRLMSALEQVADALERAGCEHLLIGANALLVRGVELKRSTRDLDFVVVTTGGMDELRSIALDAGLRPSSISHRFYGQQKVEVDLLPFDPKRPAEIPLPDDIRLTAVCLAEAFRHSSPIAIGHKLIRVPELPLLVGMKLHVASQRIEEGLHDVEDALAAMEAYAEEDDRRFQEMDYESYPQLSYELAGAFLLARDLAQLADVRTKQHLQLATDQLLREERMGDQHELGRRFRPLLRAFELGLSTAP